MSLPLLHPVPLCIVGDQLSSRDVFFSCHITVGSNRIKSVLELALSWYRDVQGQHTFLKQSMILPLLPRDCFALTTQLYYCKKKKREKIKHSTEGPNYKLTELKLCFLLELHNP